MRLLYILILLFIFQSANAQPYSDSVQLSLAKQQQQIKFQSSLNATAPIYNGTAYIRYWNKEVGHPFFETDQFQKCSIVFKGFEYKNFLLKYDLFKNQLVSLNATGEFEMELLKEHVSDFKIGAHEFIKISTDSVRADMPAPGFYELLYDGKSRVIAKYNKRIEASLKAEENVSRFVDYANYYILVKDDFHLITHTAVFLKLHKEQKTVLRKYINKENLKFSKLPVKSLVSLAKYYDSISNE